MSQTVFRFKGVLERFPGKGGWYFVRFPHPVAALFGTRGTVRMKGRMNEIPVDRALMPDGAGGHFIVLGADLRRKAGLRLGAEVSFSLERDETPEVVVLPEAFEVALNLDPEALSAFGRLTPGLKRSLVSWVAAGKRAETQEQRSAELLKRLVAGHYQKSGTKSGK